MESIWSRETEIPRRESLDGDTEAFAVVIGAGMSGILTAYYLKQSGFDVVVLEADRIGSGQSGKTTAKITSQHGLCYAKMLKRLGPELAGIYAAANEGAIAEYERLIQKKGIKCHFEKISSYLYSTENVDLLKEETDAAQKLGINAEFVTETELPFQVKGAVCFKNQAQFQPLEFIKEIAKDIKIYEHTKVRSVGKNIVYTNKGNVRAEHIIFATHYPIMNVPGMYFVRQHQERSYVLALSENKPIQGMYRSIDKNGLSLRSSGNILLLGRGKHRTGKCASVKRKEEDYIAEDTSDEVGVYQYLRECANKYYPDSNEVTRWSAQDCMPHDEMPFIGRYSVFRSNWYVATGFGKWGMTSSMIAALLISDEICGRENPYEKLFKPQRLHLWAFPAFMKDFGESVMGLGKGAVHLPVRTENALSPGEAGIVREGWRRYACFKDEKGALHKISARCPHMGCELAWNGEEHSWDCPCHGSRFDCDGKLLDNPAQIDKS